MQPTEVLLLSMLTALWSVCQSKLIQYDEGIILVHRWLGGGSFFSRGGSVFYLGGSFFSASGSVVARKLHTGGSVLENA